MGHVRFSLTKRLWDCYVEWGYGSFVVTVKAWTRAGASRAAVLEAKRRKPKADVRFVSLAQVRS